MWKRMLLIFGILILAGCTTTSEIQADSQIDQEFSIHPNDPLEGFNRAMWTVNYDYLDPYLLRPVSLAYVDYVPSFIRTGIRNFLSNLEEPFMMVNNILTLNGKGAINHFNRFWINSTFGVGGLLDIAGKAGETQVNDKQFGDVLGSYGIGQGPFIMLPGYGPTTIRESAGDFVDGFYPPLSLLTFPQSLLKWIFSGMEERAALVSQETLLNNSPDPYAFARDAYLQNKEFRANDGKVEEEKLDDTHLNEELLDEVDDY